MRRAMPARTHGTAVVRSFSHSERMTAIMPGPRASGRPGRTADGAPASGMGAHGGRIGGVEAVGQAEEDVLEAAPLVDQLVQDDLVLGGERPEPLGRGAVDDQDVRAVWR